MPALQHGFTVEPTDDADLNRLQQRVKLAFDKLAAVAVAAPNAVTSAQLRAALGTAGRADAWRAAQGIIAETAAHNECGFISPPGPANSVVYLAQLFLVAGEVLTKAAISTSQTSPGVQTAGFLGIYAPGSFAKVATTASVGNAWQAAAGNLQFANLVPAYTVPTTGIYYAAFLAVFTGQAPNILMAMPPQTGGGGAGAVNGLYYLTHNVVTATLPATIAPATATFAPIIPWIGFF
jgi:hypothetical protein